MIANFSAYAVRLWCWLSHLLLCQQWEIYVQIMVVDCSLWAESDSYFFVTCSNQPIFCESQLLFTICFSKHSKLFTVFSELVFVVVVSSERNFDSDKFSIFKNGANKIPPLLDKQILSGKRYRTFPAPKFFLFLFFLPKTNHSIFITFAGNGLQVTTARTNRRLFKCLPKKYIYWTRIRRRRCFSLTVNTRDWNFKLAQLKM